MTPEQMIQAGINALQSAGEHKLTHTAAAAVANAWAGLALAAHTTGTYLPEDPGCDCPACMQAIKDAIEADRRNR